MNFDNCYPTIAKQAELSMNISDYDVMHVHFGETGVVDFNNRHIIKSASPKSDRLLVILHYDAEPMDYLMIHEFSKAMGASESINTTKYVRSDYIIATSDFTQPHIKYYIDNIDDYKATNKNCQSEAKIWYYFLHGFIALDWFREYKFYDTETLIHNRTFEHNFITMNRLVSGARNYRLCLMSRLEKKSLTGLISYSPYTNKDDFELNYLLPDDEVRSVAKYCSKAKRFDLQGDNVPNDSMHINVEAHLSSFLHVVTETCYYQKFNHLTEKVFKPIVMMQPFILAGTVGSLKYLKRYGFKTFSKWIDESYDKIKDPLKRLDAIAAEVEKICNLTKEEQRLMYEEMLPTLIHNRRHFYGKFYDILHKEMWDNFSLAIPKT